MFPRFSWEQGSVVPPLPHPPGECFARDEVIARSLSYLGDLVSVILPGGVGVGKTAIALTLLHHDHVKTRFSVNRYFMRCDDLANSLRVFLERLTNAIGLPPIGSMELLRPHLTRLRPLHPLMLVLDGVECILDPLAGESKQIAATIEEVSRYSGLCLLATSRMAVNISGFQTIEVPNISGDGARDIFYSLCSLDRSAVIDNLIASLDSHPLSTVFLARVACEENWDELTLVREWDDIRTGILRSGDNQSLGIAIESALATPMIRHFGPAVKEILEAIAPFPIGVEERRVGNVLPGIDGIGDIIDILCRFYLVERQDRLVKMISPLRFHFLDNALTMIHTPRAEENGNDSITEERDEVPCHTAIGGSCNVLQSDCGVDIFQSPTHIYRWSSTRWKRAQPSHCWGEAACPSRPRKGGLVPRLVSGP